jgi:1-acyl-sn-glycerol-3-phosphate acyltransferase
VGGPVFYFLMRFVFLGPILRLVSRPRARGLENIPEGPAILAANHQSFLDDFLLPLVIPKRKVVFLGKAEYFDKWYLKWFFKAANVIPVRRQNSSASQAALDAAVGALRDGKLVGIFPEGTRSPDGKLYRGKTGVARMALEARVPIVPVALIGTFESLPYDRRLPKRRRVEVVFGKPLIFDRHYESRADRFVLRSITDEVMYEIMLLSGQEYVDEYGSKVKSQIDRARALQEQGRGEPGADVVVLPEASESPAASIQSPPDRPR